MASAHNPQLLGRSVGPQLVTSAEQLLCKRPSASLSAKPATSGRRQGVPSSAWWPDPCSTLIGLALAASAARCASAMAACSSCSRTLPLVAAPLPLAPLPLVPVLLAPQPHAPRPVPAIREPQCIFKFLTMCSRLGEVIAEKEHLCRHLRPPIDLFVRIILSGSVRSKTAALGSRSVKISHASRSASSGPSSTVVRLTPSAAANMAVVV